MQQAQNAHSGGVGGRTLPKGYGKTCLLLTKPYLAEP